MYQGSESDEDSKSLFNKFSNVYPDNMVQWGTKKYDTYFDKTKDQAKSRSIYVLATISLADHYHNITSKAFILTDSIVEILL